MSWRLAGERECAQSAFWVRLLIWASRHVRADAPPGHSRESGNPAS